MWVLSETSLGTSERRWRHEPAVTEAPEMDWGLPARVVVVAPHPDDETLALGGTLSMLVRRGFEIRIVAVTDGEGSHPRSATISRAELAARRPLEQAAALAELGIGDGRIERLRIGDGAVSAVDLASQLAPLVKEADFVLAPFARDGHPDHDACGRAAEAVHSRVFSYVVWAWHWGTPGSDALPWRRLRRSTLDAEARHAKARAIAKFQTQIAPLSSLPGDEALLPATVLDRFARPFETVIVHESAR